MEHAGDRQQVRHRQVDGFPSRQAGCYAEEARASKAVNKHACKPYYITHAKTDALQARKMLVRLSNSDAVHRRMALVQICALGGFPNVCPKTARDAFAKEGHRRRSARKKPFLTERHMLARFKFANDHAHWTVSCSWTRSAAPQTRRGRDADATWTRLLIMMLILGLADRRLAQSHLDGRVLHLDRWASREGLRHARSRRAV